jgi:hypothetical protein
VTDLQQRLAASSDQLVARMIAELDTGGNVRYEDGQPSDSWYPPFLPSSSVLLLLPVVHLSLYELGMVRVNNSSNLILQVRHIVLVMVSVGFVFVVLRRYTIEVRVIYLMINLSRSRHMIRPIITALNQSWYIYSVMVIHKPWILHRLK